MHLFGQNFPLYKAWSWVFSALLNCVPPSTFEGWDTLFCKMWRTQVALYAISLQHWGLPVHLGRIKLLIQPEIVYSSKRDKIWPNSKLLRQEHSFPKCLRFSSSSKASGCCSWLSLLSLMWWHSIAASQGHPWGSPPEFGISRNYIFKVNNSSLADVPLQDSYKGTLQDCWGVKNGTEFSNSVPWPETPEEGKLVCPVVYKTSVRSKTVYCMMYWQKWSCGFHILSSHLPTALWHLSDGTGCPFFSCTSHGEVSGHGKVRVI